MRMGRVMFSGAYPSSAFASSGAGSRLSAEGQGTSSRHFQGRGERVAAPWGRRRADLLVAGCLSAALAAATFGLPVPASASAAPLISGTSFSAVTESAATLEAAIDTQAVATTYHFEYITQAAYEVDGDTFGAGSESLPAPDAHLPARAKAKGNLEAGSAIVTGLEVTAGSLAEGQTVTAGGGGIPTGTAILSVEAAAGRLSLSKAATLTTASPVNLTATGPQPVALRVEGLAPSTAYRFRIFAENSSQETATGPDTLFFTLAAPPTFGPCPNDAFRSGEFAAVGHPSASLPDCRAYEQASPVEKDGNDVLGELGFVRAADDGDGITFMSTSGIPGGEGAQTLPTYLASRGEGGAGWSSQGILPPATFGSGAGLRGWLPNLSETFAVAVRQGEGSTESALFARRTSPAGPPSPITPYAKRAEPTYAGASADGSEVAFEAEADLGTIPAGLDGKPNVYTSDRETNSLHLASVLNSASETEEVLPSGAVAGPYAWMEQKVSKGGAARGYYLQEEGAVSADGSLFFTAVGSGRLFRRLHPSQPQSPMEGTKCLNPALACTIELSASTRTELDSGGAQPAAFHAASIDGSTAYFTSSEELTNSARTGPQQPPAQVDRADLNAPDPDATKEEGFIAAHAVGLATSPDGEYLYWADPIRGTIGRAKLNADGTHGSVENEFIVPGETKAETHPELEPGVIRSAPSAPRYVAVDDEYVYWTNRGPLGEEERNLGTARAVEKGGTVGRARIDKTLPPEPEFIKGTSNPQGIAVNNEHIYWANAGESGRSIARASIAGSGVEQDFYPVLGSQVPFGVAVSAGDVYFTINGEINNGSGNSFVSRIPLEGGTEEFVGSGKSALRGIAVDGGNVYWTAQRDGAIGRIPVADFPQLGSCEQTTGCERNFIEGIEGALVGLTNANNHLYFSVNGETPPHPGSDLYRYRSGELKDVTVDPTDENGAEVKGLLGSSDDGSYVYFIANGDLDQGGEAEEGNCQGVIGNAGGSCNLYQLHNEEITFISPLNHADSRDWQASSGLNSFYAGKLSDVSPDGRTLLFYSSEDLTPYANHGISELYRYHAGSGISCASCDPSGAEPERGSAFESAQLPEFQPAIAPAATQARNLAGDGTRVFFETTEALVVSDTDGATGCPHLDSVGSASQFYRICTDVYEWEVPGAGSCEAGGPGYSPLNQGCLYLLSPGNDGKPSFFADASASGDDVFIFTQSPMVGQDTDQLYDIYDSRAGGGLAAQNPVAPLQCEGEGCRAPAIPPPTFTAPPAFFGPPDPRPGRCKANQVKRHGRCFKKHNTRHKKRHRRHATHAGDSK